jgi:glyoxylase-like metal-dependent hydrolase (beta-lactamase superfamily II)
MLKNIKTEKDFKLYYGIVSPLYTNTYYIFYNGIGIIIDPGDDGFKIYRFLKERDLKIDYIIATHGHIDHIGGVYELKEYGGAKFFLHHNDKEIYKALPIQASYMHLKTPKIADIDIDDDLYFLSDYDIEIIHTPGHTEGSVSIYLPYKKILFTGDLLFKEGIGRYDLWGGDGEKLKKSILELYNTIEDDTLVLPGHGEFTTIKYEKRHNPFVSLNT